MKDELKPEKRDDHDDRYDAHKNGDMKRKEQGFMRANPTPSDLTALGISLPPCVKCGGRGGDTGAGSWRCRTCNGTGEDTSTNGMLAAVMSQASGKTTKQLLAEALQVYKDSR